MLDDVVGDESQGSESRFLPMSLLVQPRDILFCSLNNFRLRLFRCRDSLSSESSRLISPIKNHPLTIWFVQWTIVGLDPEVIWTRELALEILYNLYNQEHWDEGLTLAQASPFPDNSPTESRQARDQDRDRSHSSQAQTNVSGAPTPAQSSQVQSQPVMSGTDPHTAMSSSMNLNASLPPQPQQMHMFAAALSDPSLFNATTGPAGDAMTGMGVGVGGAGGMDRMGDELGDPNM